MQKRPSSQSWIQLRVIDGRQIQTQIALVEWAEELPVCSLLVKVHTVDVRSRAYIRSSLAVLLLLLTTRSRKPNSSTNLVVEVAPVDLIHQRVRVSLRSMVESTLLLRRLEVMVVAEELLHMCMLDSGHGIGRCMGSRPMRKP